MRYEKALGKAIAKARAQAGLTQRQLGDELGVTDQTVSNWERGRHPIYVGTLARIEGITGATGLMEIAGQTGVPDTPGQASRPRTGWYGYALAAA